LFKGKRIVDSYDSFYRKNKDRIFAYLLRLTGDYHLSNDFMQESFVRYFSHYHTTPGNNCALLFTIARNAFLDSIRKYKEEKFQDKKEVAWVSNPESQLIEKQALDKMLAAIQKLNSVDRELVALLATKTFSYKEIGKILNISETNVKVKVHRARLRLKAILKNGGQ
jgi:RNA polymerase sigma-70 factor (ECF subfamily)